MLNRWLAVTILLLVGALVVGAVSVVGELKGTQGAAEAPELVRINGKLCLPYEPTAIEAELLDDGRTVLLMPHADDVVVKDGARLEALRPSCLFDDGKFYTCQDGRPQRIWLFAAVSEEKPKVQVMQDGR